MNRSRFPERGGADEGEHDEMPSIGKREQGFELVEYATLSRCLQPPLRHASPKAHTVRDKHEVSHLLRKLSAR